MDFAQDNGIRGLRPHAGVAQPDPGLVLPARRRHAAHDQRRRQDAPAEPAARPHLRRGPDPQRPVRPVRQRHQPARRVRRRQRGRLDGTTEADGLRRSPWYNGSWASRTSTTPSRPRTRRSTRRTRPPGSDRPVTLHINDYNTEQSRQAGAAARPRRSACWIAASRSTRVGHQFHLSLSTPVGTLDEALDSVRGPAGEPGRQRARRDGRHAGRPGQAHRPGLLLPRRVPDLPGPRRRPLLGDPVGPPRRPQLAVGAARRSCSTPTSRPSPPTSARSTARSPARLRTAFVFQGNVALDAAATDALEWQQLPLHRFGNDKVGFQLRWEPDHLTAYVEVADATPRGGRCGDVRRRRRDLRLPARRHAATSPGVVDDEAGRLAGGRPPAVVRRGASATSWRSTSRVADGATTVGWNDAGATGTLTLVEPLSFTDVAEAATAPVIDGETDAVWADGEHGLDRQADPGQRTAPAPIVRTLWKDNTLYVLADVTDPILDDTGSDPWTEDSVEIYVDAGNVKNGSYRFDDTQIRINYNNVHLVRHRRRGLPGEPADQRHESSPTATSSRRRSASSRPAALARSTASTSRSTTRPPAPGRRSATGPTRPASATRAPRAGASGGSSPATPPCRSWPSTARFTSRRPIPTATTA